MRRRWWVAGLAAVMMVLSVSAPAAASPPDVTFTTARETVPAFLRNYCWSAYDPPFIRQECLRGDVPVPDGVRMAGLHKAQWLIDHPQEPDEIELVYWTGGRWTRPAQVHELEVTADQVVTAAGVSSALSFEVPKGWRNLSLELRAAWNMEATCPTCGQQWGLWRVTLRK